MKMEKFAIKLDKKVYDVSTSKGVAPMRKLNQDPLGVLKAFKDYYAAYVSRLPEHRRDLDKECKPYCVWMWCVDLITGLNMGDKHLENTVRDSLKDVNSAKSCVMAANMVRDFLSDFGFLSHSEILDSLITSADRFVMDNFTENDAFEYFKFLD